MRRVALPSMPDTYINVPVTEAERKRIEREDATWTAPRLITLCAVTLGGALLLLWAMANGYIGPTVHS